MTILEKLIARVQAVGMGSKLVATCRELIAEGEALKAAATGSGRRARKPRSAKAKGREGVVQARKWILGWYPSLADDDILIQTTSVGGSDLHYSPLARSNFPFAPEVKNCESLNIWAALRQAEINATKRKLEPVLFFKRNNTEMWVAFPCRALHHVGVIADGQAAGRSTEGHPEEGPGSSGV